MRKALIHRHGGPEVIQIVALSTPPGPPGPGEALVRVEAAGVNYIDTYHRSGLYPLKLPAGLGLEGAGHVEALGPDSGDLKVGQAVAWADVPGSYATHVLAPAARLVPVPDGVDLRTAAAAMLQGMTAHYLTHSTYRLQAGDTCLVHAAAGGMGLLLCQMGRQAGARVLGTASTADKAELALQAGADEVIRYRDVDWVKEARRLSGGRGVDVVYDGVGRDTFEGSLDVLRPRGMMVLYGQASGPVPPVDLQVFSGKGSLFFTRPSLRYYVASREELLSRAQDVLGAIAKGSLRIRIHAALPLSQAQQAHALLQGRGTSGKLLLLPQE